MADHTRVTRPRTGLALVLPLLSLCFAAPALADARLVVQRHGGDPEVVHVPAAREQRALRKLNADPGVRFAAPDVAVHAATSDSAWMYQWALDDPGDTPEHRSVYHGEAVQDADIDAPEAWAALSPDARSVTVAVADTRIDTAQPDLAGRLVLPGGPDVPGCTASTPPDHGTAVAGVVAANTDNGKGIAGVAPNARILPVPALDDCGGGTLGSVLAAFDYASTHGAQIVVASFSTSPLLPQDQKDALKDAFDAFFAEPEHSNTLFVVAAGNEGNDNDPNDPDANPVYPCSSDAPNVICVGRSNIDDGPSCESNVGKQSVDLFAPGDRIWTTVWSDGNVAKVAPESGTSMSAPMVAGVAAMMAGQLPPVDGGDTANRPPNPPPPTADELANTLRGPSAVDARDGMSDFSVSGGRLNAAKALGAPGTDELVGGHWADWQTCDPDHDDFAGLADKCPDVAGSATAAGCPDADGDGVQDTADACRDQPGPEGLNGCPDGDGDGVVDGSDNCPGVANPGQEDADRDGVGDACDSAPRGPDADGDGFGALDDQCPAQAGTQAGCPVYVPPPPPPYTPPVVVNPPPPVVAPVVAPKIVSVGVRVAHSRRSARVTVRLSRTLRAKVTVERRVRRHHHRVWSRVLRRSVTFTARGRHMTVRTRKRGSYRVTVRLTGAKTVRRNFRV
jgi:subtilisin family serine protease